MDKRLIYNLIIKLIRCWASQTDGRDYAQYFYKWMDKCGGGVAPPYVFLSIHFLFLLNFNRECLGF